MAKEFRKITLKPLNGIRLAAEQNNANAQNNLGYMYLNGYGVSKDYTEAVKWYRLAAQQGNINAKENLKELGETR